MPSKRRSHASNAAQARDTHEVQSETSGSRSPKITRSGRVLPPQDIVEQESTTRSAKRRKTASPPPIDTTVEQDVEYSTLEEPVQEDLNEDLPAAGSGTEDVPEHDITETSGRGEDHQEVQNEDHRIRANETKTAPAVSPPTAEAVGAPVLDRLADDILTIITKVTPQELGSAIKTPASSSTGKQYLDLQEQFTFAKQKYSSAAFLSPPELGSTGSTETCRKVNLATFVSSLFDGRVSLEELDNYFLFLFVPRGGTLSKLAASLWLELKTQAFIASIVTGDQRPANTVLTLLFNEDVRQRLLDIRIGFDTLADSEEEFLESLRSRKAELAQDTSELTQTHSWENFLSQATSYIKVLKLDDAALTGSERLLLKPATQMDGSSWQGGGPNGTNPLRNLKTSGYLDEPEESFQHKSARCALLAIQSVGQPYFTHEGLPWPLIPFSTELAQGPRPDDEEGPEVSIADPINDVPTEGEKDMPHSSQTAPTVRLLERARKASDVEALHPKSTANMDANKSELRPWKPEEEQTLLEELDRVQGPQWDKIVENDKLKERNEVQLKEKAQSLKLFFLKAGVEVPFWLRVSTGVTGNSRSGSVAAPLKREETPSATSAASKGDT